MHAKVRFFLTVSFNQSSLQWFNSSSHAPERRKIYARRRKHSVCFM